MWTLQRVLYHPDNSRHVVEDIFSADRQRNVFTATISKHTAERLGKTPELVNDEIRSNWQAMVLDASVNPLLGEFAHDAHARIIGEQQTPVVLTGQQLVYLVRHQAVFDLEPARFGVQEVGWLASMRSIVRWAIPGAALAGLIVAVLGALARPSRSDLLFALGVFGVSAGFFVFMLGYVVPTFGVPLMIDQVWEVTIAASGAAALPIVGGASVGLAALGAGLVFLTLNSGARRRPGGWSPPRQSRVRNDQRQWSG